MEESKETAVTQLHGISFKFQFILYPVLTISVGLIWDLLFPGRKLTFIRIVVHYLLLGLMLPFLQRYVVECGLPFAGKLLRFIIIMLISGVIIIGADKLFF